MKTEEMLKDRENWLRNLIDIDSEKTDIIRRLEEFKDNNMPMGRCSAAKAAESIDVELPFLELITRITLLEEIEAESNQYFPNERVLH